MDNRICGLHHITAIAGNAKRNHDFYTRVMGLRFVKKTVNFDDPGTYHFYFGDEVGTPGTVLTFFPWEGIRSGRQGTGMATEIGYSVPGDSLAFWRERLARHGVTPTAEGERFGAPYVSFHDPDGLPLALISAHDDRAGWTTPETPASVATRGFHSITLSPMFPDATAKVLTEILDYRFTGQEDNRLRYVSEVVSSAAVVDVLTGTSETRAINAAGTIHHVAFRVKNEQVLMKYREKVLSYGFNITPKIDRNYFFSLYFREPGGILFELATDNPGFTVDEPLHQLGTGLRLPPQYEERRSEIEKALPPL